MDGLAAHSSSDEVPTVIFSPSTTDTKFLNFLRSTVLRRSKPWCLEFCFVTTSSVLLYPPASSTPTSS